MALGEYGGEEVETLIPSNFAPSDAVTVTIIDHTNEMKKVIEYDLPPTATIQDIKSHVIRDLKYEPRFFDVMSVKQRILPLYTTIESLSNDPKTFYLIKSPLSKVTEEVRSHLIEAAAATNNETAIVLHPTAATHDTWSNARPTFGPLPAAPDILGWNKKSSTGYVGLSNQGATCYMNSLIQTLYMTPEFRWAVYTWDWPSFLEREKASRLEKLRAEGKTDISDSEVEGEIEAKSIPRQLQKLFARLQLSEQKAVKTKDLTKSFGWSDADAFTQHDVQELCRVLFDALEKSFKGTKNEDIINRLYQGVMKDYVKCKECGQESKRTDFYLDVPLVLKAFGATKSVGSIEEALGSFSQPETLEGDNQYFCEKCQKKVDALKGLALVKLPYLLTLQLKRFDFDYERMERIKLNDVVTFPFMLNMRPYIETEEPEDEPINYELYSVLIHRGSSLGGHYYAYIKAFENGKWFEFNDSQVNEITQADVEKGFGEASSHSSYLVSNSNAYMLLYRKVDPSNLQSVSADDMTEELKAMVTSENKVTQEKEEKDRNEREMTKFKILYNNKKKLLQVNKSLTYAEITTKALELFDINPSDIPTDCVRLRLLYNEGVLGEVLVPEKTPTALGYIGKRLFLDIRSADEEFPPSDWHSFKVKVYDPEAKIFKPSVYVYLSDPSTVAELKVVLEKKFGIPKEEQRVIWRQNPPVELLDDEKKLEIPDGGQIFLERKSDTETPESQPLSFAEIERQQSNITIAFNIPPSQELNQIIVVNKDLTLKEFREKIQKLVNLPLDGFRTSRVSYPSKLEIPTDPTKNLLSYFPAAGDKPDKVYKVLIEIGRPENTHEITLKFSKFHLQGLPGKPDDLFEPTVEVQVTTDMSVRQVKELLAKKLKDEKQVEVDPNLLRLRETVSLSGSLEPFTVFTDGQLIKDLFIRPERTFAFQVLDEPESIELSDLNIFTQEFNRGELKLGERVELVMKSQQKGLEDIREKISENHNVPVEHIALNRWGVWLVKLPQLIDARWESPSEAAATTSPYSAIYPNKCDLIYWCDTRIAPAELSKEERLKLNKTAGVRRGHEKALTINV